MPFLIHNVPVTGGTLTVGEAGSRAPDAPVVLALHGMLESHRSFAWLADRLPGFRMLAPDLRGRGGSATLPGPYGLEQHSIDLVAVLDHFGVDRALVVGHCLGAFAALALRHRWQHGVVSTVLLDGGLPLAVPLHLSTNEIVELVLGRAGRGYPFAFSSREAHLGFMRQHPALRDTWTPEIESYIDSLVDARVCADGVGFAPIVAERAVEADARELYSAARLRRWLDAPFDPTTVVVAPRGLANETPGLYTLADVEMWAAEFPFVEIVEAVDVNHYSLLVGDAGARQVAMWVEAAHSGAVSAARRQQT